MLAIYAIHWSRGSWGATKSFPTTCLLGVVAKNAGICWNRMTLFISLFTIKTANLKTSGFVEKPRVFFISHVFVGFWVLSYIYIYSIYIYVYNRLFVEVTIIHHSCLVRAAPSTPCPIRKIWKWLGREEVCGRQQQLKKWRLPLCPGGPTGVHRRQTRSRGRPGEDLQTQQVVDFDSKRTWSFEKWCLWHAIKYVFF